MHACLLVLGSVTESGTYEQMMQKEGPFATMIREHMQGEDLTHEHQAKEEKKEEKKDASTCFLPFFGP